MSGSLFRLVPVGACLRAVPTSAEGGLWELLHERTFLCVGGGQRGMGRAFEGAFWGTRWGEEHTGARRLAPRKDRALRGPLGHTTLSVRCVLLEWAGTEIQATVSSEGRLVGGWFVP